MLLARYKKLGGSLVAGGLIWRTDEGRSKFLMGVCGDLSTTFHGKGTTSSLRFTTDGRARLQSCRERLNIMRLLPPRYFTSLLYHEREGHDFQSCRYALAMMRLQPLR